MIETSVEYLGGLRFAVTARGHRVICDQPAGAQGTDTGMTPPEFLLASLGACAGVYAADYLRARSLPAEGLAVRVVAEKSLGPARLSAFQIEITAPGLEDERHRAGLVRAAKACLIHNTLMQPPSIEVVLASPVEAGLPVH